MTKFEWVDCDEYCELFWMNRLCPDIFDRVEKHFLHSGTYYTEGNGYGKEKRVFRSSKGEDWTVCTLWGIPRLTYTNVPEDHEVDEFIKWLDEACV